MFSYVFIGRKGGMKSERLRAKRKGEMEEKHKKTKIIDKKMTELRKRIYGWLGGQMDEWVEAWGGV